VLIGTGDFAPSKQKKYHSKEIHKNVDKAVDKPVGEFRKCTIVFNLDHIAYGLGTNNFQYNQLLEYFSINSYRLLHHLIKLSTARECEHDDDHS